MQAALGEGLALAGQDGLIQTRRVLALTARCRHRTVCSKYLGVMTLLWSMISVTADTSFITKTDDTLPFPVRTAC